MKVWIRWAGSDVALGAFTAGKTKNYNFGDQRARFSVGDIAFLVFGPVDDPEGGNIRGWERVTRAAGHEWTSEIGQIFEQKFDGRELRLLPHWRVLRGPRHIDASGQPENAREIPADALQPFLQFIRDTGERVPPELLNVVRLDEPVPRASDPVQTYVTGDFLSEGVYGRVYRGFDAALERPVALKFLKADARTVIELHRQAKALAKVRHPNVLTVYCLANARNPDTQQLEPCIVMELVEGARDLEEKVQSGVTADEAIQLARGVLAGLVAIHDAGLQHGDIHDGNVLVGADGAKIIDIHVLESIANASTRTRESAIRADLTGALLVVRGVVNAAGFETALIETFSRQARRATTMRGVLAALVDAFGSTLGPPGNMVTALAVTPPATGAVRGVHPPERVAYWKAKLAEWVGRRVIVRDVEHDNYPVVEEIPGYPTNRPSPWFRVNVWEVSEEGPVFATGSDYGLCLLTWAAIESISFTGDEYYGEPNIMYLYHPDRYFEVAHRKLPPRGSDRPLR